MWRREPVAVALAGLDAAVLAILAALTALDVLSLTSEQLAAIGAAIVAVSGIVMPFLRAQVVTQDTYEHDVLEAMWTPVGVDDLDVPDDFGGASDGLDDDPADRIAWGGDV